MSISPDPLEKKIHEALRGLPARVAPTTLEARVMGAIAARRAMAWWQRPFTQWPLGLRILFLIASVTIGAGVVTGSLILHRTGPGVLLGTFHFTPWLETLTIGRAFVTLGHALHMAGEALPLQLSREWLFGFVLLYAIVLGLAATAYRTLVRSQ